MTTRLVRLVVWTMIAVLTAATGATGQDAAPEPTSESGSDSAQASGSGEPSAESDAAQASGSGEPSQPNVVICTPEQYIGGEGSFDWETDETVPNTVGSYSTEGQWINGCDGSGFDDQAQGNVIGHSGGWQAVEGAQQGSCWLTTSEIQESGIIVYVVPSGDSTTFRCSDGTVFFIENGEMTGGSPV